MPLSSTREAIGAVSEAIRSQLSLRSSLLVTVTRPDIAAAADDAVQKLNLFLYQIDFDPLSEKSFTRRWPATTFMAGTPLPIDGIRCRTR